MTELAKLQERTDGFLDPDKFRSPHLEEVYGYIQEVHEVLWKFVRAEIPDASGTLSDWIPVALFCAQRRGLKD